MKINLNDPKPRLPRPCKECGKTFNPSGPATKVCNDCLNAIRLITIERMKKIFREKNGKKE